MSKVKITCINNLFTLYLFFIFFFIFCFVFLVIIVIVRNFSTFKRYPVRKKYNGATATILGHKIGVEDSEHVKISCLCMCVCFVLFVFSTVF